MTEIQFETLINYISIGFWLIMFAIGFSCNESVAK